MLRRLVPFFVLIVLTRLAAAGDLPAARLQRLLDLLVDGDDRVRLQAVLALGQLKDRRAVPALVRRLEDRKALVRGMTAIALGVIGDPRALPGLRERTRDRDPMVRRRARASLAQILSQGREGPILVRLGGLGDRTRRGSVLLPELRRLWAERMAHTPGIRLISGSARGQKVYEVTASITQLSSQQRGHLHETTCSVSVVLGDDRGSIVMMTSGGATVQVESRRFSKSQEPAINGRALEGAVASAHSNVVKFLASR